MIEDFPNWLPPISILMLSLMSGFLTYAYRRRLVETRIRADQNTAELMAELQYTRARFSELSHSQFQDERFQQPEQIRVVENVKFDGEQVDLEGKLYINCAFIDCELFYSGYTAVRFLDCEFNRCKWSLIGSADETIQFLAGLYRGLGEPGQEMVESIFERIRESTVKPTDSVRIGPRDG